MNRLAAALALPLAAGWGLHTFALRRRLDEARRDPLTGLWTREPFEEAAARLLRAGPCAAVMADLDGLKSVNDTWGHAAGDSLIRAAAWRLDQCVTHVMSGAVGRLGGDEFAAVLPLPHSTELPLELGNIWDWLVSDAVNVGGRSVWLGASIGAAHTDDIGSRHLPTVLRRADEVMYLAKRGGGGWLSAAPGAPALPTVNGRRIGRTGTHTEPEGRAEA
ncbi:GGDEF domain-containing protein [Streptomyces sp. WMMB303]|uniref:GGDEF domain-containing protein n=1 Tax=Streptomyces sp. WMMB303 TaxID=3034154 RepID=UPI0023EBB113|nr:GGDEF domain-containing protein [Streptomyces sp. WMMB303]MDF4250442.1 GGDEF domain-containing protein [Streptomyces sp. WMMB303]